MTDPTAADVLNAWLARYDTNDEAAAHGRPFQWDADGNVTATVHNFDNVMPPMGPDEVEAVRTLLTDNERLRVLVADEHSRLSQDLDREAEYKALLTGVEVVLLDHVAELSGPLVDPNLAELAYCYLAVAGESVPAEIRDAVQAAEEAAVLCPRCGGIPCSTCGECPRQGCWDCRCDKRNRDDERENEGNG